MRSDVARTSKLPTCTAHPDSETAALAGAGVVVGFTGKSGCLVAAGFGFSGFAPSDFTDSGRVSATLPVTCLKVDSFAAAVALVARFDASPGAGSATGANCAGDSAT